MHLPRLSWLWTARLPRIVLVAALAAVVIISTTFLVRRCQSQSHLDAARAALATRDFAGARSHIDSYLSSFPEDAQAHLLAAQALRRAALLDTLAPGWDATVWSHLREASRQGADADVIRFESALTAALGGAPESERALLRRATGDGPEAMAALETLVRVNLDNHQFGHARRCVDRLLELDPDNALALFWRGLIRELQMQLEPQLADYARAVELAPDLDAARLRLAGCLIMLNRHSEAAPHYRQLLAHRPEDPEGLLGLASCCQAVGDFGEATTLLDRLLALDPAHGAALLLKGRVSFALGKPALAEEWLRRGMARNPYDAQAYYTLAQCLSKRGDQAGAARAQARADELTADWKRAHEITGRISREPNDAGLRALAGELLLRLGQNSLAVNWLNSALQIEPHQPAAHRALARYYDQKGDNVRAAEHRRLGGTAVPAVENTLGRNGPSGT